MEPIDHEQPHRPVPTPTKYMNKCLALQKIYAELAKDLQQEIDMVQNRLVTPAEQARAHLKPLKKTLKHRENTKLDYERYLGRTEHAQKKQTRSMKEEAALAKHESDLAQAHIDYQTADDQIKETFPPLTAAVKGLLPQLMALQIRIQTTLVGQYYTILDQFTREHGMPNPAPGNAEIVAVHDREFTGLRKELETGLMVVAKGKAVNMPMALPDKDDSTISGYGIRNKSKALISRKSSNQKLAPARPAVGAPQDQPLQLKATPEYQDYDEEPAPVKPPRPSHTPSYGMPSPAIPSYGNSSPAMPSPAIPTASKPRIPSTSAQTANPPPYSEKPSPMLPDYSNAGQSYGGGATPPSYANSPSSNLGGSDYFSAAQEKARRASAASSVSAASIAAKKKKPPPPVPTKRLPSVQQAQYVTALYDFEGQAEGDLAFREGDRIRIVKKTESTDDWWDGEIGGVTGCFPANYVRMG